ncbi:MAG: OmpA family protein, partial [Flavobacteriales bacterium]
VLNAHTDSRGDKSYNNRLSVKRALACRAYMIKIGVDPDRIKYTGFGESKLVNDCGDGIPCPEDKHLLNRRIEFTVLLN